MDKSLKFFTSLYQKPTSVKTDPNTGLPLTNIEGEVIINYYDKIDPTKVVRTENKKYSFEAGAENGQVMNYLGNSPLNEVPGIPINPEEESDIRLSSIIKWTQENNKKLYLQAKDFVSLKNFNSAPANRMIILRRFSGAAPHNLFNSKSSVKPIATLVGYYDFENLPVKISFNEKWKQFDSNLLAVVQDVIGIKFDSIPGIGDLFSKASSSPFGQDLLYTVAEKLNFVSGGQMPYGDPNLIHDAAIRDVSGEGLSTGLESSIEVDFETSYVMNEQLGTDGRANMLSLISEVHKMGTSNGRFAAGNAAAVGQFFRGLENGDISLLVEAFSSAISSVIQVCKKLITADPKQETNANGEKKELKEGEILDAAQAKADAMLRFFTNGVNELVQARFARYRWKIKGAVGALTGGHTAPWHISIGNPKHPWFVCGNMVLETCEIIPGGELGYNDMFTEFTVKIKLRSGRTMHRGELESLFNSGSGRIYDKPEKVLTYNVMDGTEVIVPASGGPISVNNSAANNNSTPNRPIDPAQNL